ncbi:MAG TPA: mercuric transporter MerT family protein, partial [Candidatus Polarisedimenticolia bacterium]|nr:mercuric transporter MerT family protein [Candidatus Polarisedimenticolia bacterium]
MSQRLFQAGSLLSGTVAAVTSAAASICCIGPLAIALLGVNGAILAAAFKPYRVYLLSGSLVLLAGAFWSAYRRPPMRHGA